ncbi:hypothetical protein RFM26_21135 [Mesorhizobium sp. VK23B]|uniref:Uncharacterized protein n=1 Tax=Mesorhizobium dulcispinae TaxID=3072316 RepID=A0ABU4XIR0_9HYPH|nr:MULTISPECIES: hypothetical protein [unclassified Mesorhizobium]MDX8468206.1 hypothetical protein [Mesorhizobium sp. VK23B]MDX8474544.1 hypothetical protein [Mesorhizobium sp. VK23A]MDX8520495.1 hypothetical protein [Mesorhizobium sp. VK23D]
MTTISSSWRGLPRPALLGQLLFFCAGFAIGSALHALAPRLPWVAGIPLVAIACLGFGTVIGKTRDPSASPEDNTVLQASSVENYR